MSEFSGTLQTVKKMFPDLGTTRFKNQSEFYSLFLVVWNLRQKGLILNDRTRNRTAMELLRRFSDGVDEVRERQRKARGAKASQRMFADYLLLVQQSTDALSQRTRRGEVVASLFAGIFERKDDRRTFSSEQRRMLWNSDEKKKCRNCGDTLDWTDFQIDHLLPHSRGGRTELRNAALMCRPCNLEKGATVSKP